MRMNLYFLDGENILELKFLGARSTKRTGGVN